MIFSYNTYIPLLIILVIVLTLCGLIAVTNISGVIMNTRDLYEPEQDYILLQYVTVEGPLPVKLVDIRLLPQTEEKRPAPDFPWKWNTFIVENPTLVSQESYIALDNPLRLPVAHHIVRDRTFIVALQLRIDELRTLKTPYDLVLDYKVLGIPKSARFYFDDF